MSRILVLSIIVASLSTIVGCGARGGVTKVTSADCARDEASWTPPEEVAMSIAASPEATEKQATTTVSMRPNRGQDRPTRGAIHAATY